MPFRDIPLFHKLVRSFRVYIGDEPPLSAELTRELEDLRKFSLSLLMTFLTVHTMSASNALGATTLALLAYTINLHITANTTFLQNSPTLSRFLHAVPLLGIFCMVVFKLVIVVKSPAVAAAILLACALPLLIITVDLGRRYAGMISIPFPVQMRGVTTVILSPADMTVVSS